MINQSLLRSTVAVAFLLATFSISHAQAIRTWVSGVGDDVNPCSRTAPCKTFAGAISKTAAGGEIDALDPAGFGGVTITKSVTIDASAVGGGILAAGINGININITGDSDTAKSVRLRGININGAGTGVSGIRIMAANSVTIEDVVIDGFKSDGINLDANSATRVMVRNTTIRNVANAAINNNSAKSQVAMSGVAISFNAVGLAGAGPIVSFKNNLFFGNGKDGEPTSSVALK